MKWLSVVLLLVGAVAAYPQAQSPKEAKTVQQEQKELVALQARHDATQKAFQKHPKEAALRKQYVFATVQLGMHTMYATSLTPHVKYVRALNFFKEALKYDPNNKDARTQKELIESVYRSMGRKPGG